MIAIGRGIVVGGGVGRCEGWCNRRRSGRMGYDGERGIDGVIGCNILESVGTTG